MHRNSLRRRVDTRLAWLGLTHKDFARAIAMDKATLSRSLRADHPRAKTVGRISKGLDLSPEELLDVSDTDVLTRPHSAFVDAERTADVILEWLASC